ncbi:hypothetical protein AB0G05_45165 [Nonomuraea wenchangensis]
MASTCAPTPNSLDPLGKLQRADLACRLAGQVLLALGRATRVGLGYPGQGWDIQSTGYGTAYTLTTA